ncbi:Oxidation resistance protein 1, partial [Durusdinium trenchii]
DPQSPVPVRAAAPAAKGDAAAGQPRAGAAEASAEKAVAATETETSAAKDDAGPVPAPVQAPPAAGSSEATSVDGVQAGEGVGAAAAARTSAPVVAPVPQKQAPQTAPSVSAFAAAGTPGVTALKICGRLGLAAEDAQSVAAMFGAKHESAEVSRESFVDVTAQLSHGSTADMRRVMFKGATGVEGPAEEGFAGLFRCAFHAACGLDAGAFNTGPLVAGLRAFNEIQGKLDGAAPGAAINFGMFNRWCSAEVPALHEAFSALVKTRLVTGGSKREHVAGRLGEQELARVATSEVLDVGTAFTLACADGRFQSGWTKLFSSSRDGMSFDALGKSVTGYPSTTLLMVRDTEQNCFGGMASETWNESGLFFGRPTSMLLATSPAFRLYRSRTDGSAPGTGNFQFFKARGRTGNLGIGFGGDEHTPRLWLDRDLDACRADEHDLTYIPGPLKPSEGATGSMFKPLVIEVWGMGDAEAIQAQAEALAEREQMQMDRRKVDRKKFADNAFDREFLLGKTFAHSEQQENRGGR